MNNLIIHFLFSFLFLLIIPATLTADSPNQAPESNGIILNADLENFSEGYVQPLNAGVRWLGDPFSGRSEGTVEITKTFAYEGKRSAHIKSLKEKQIARIRFQRRYNAPEISGDTVCEFLFRPAKHEQNNLNGIRVWECRSKKGKQAGLILIANGSKTEGTYSLDLLHGNKSKEKSPVLLKEVVKNLSQTDWLRFVLHRQKETGLVHLWIGIPGNEKHVGSYPDLNVKADLHSVEIGDTSTAKHFGSGFWDNIRIGSLLKEGEKIAEVEPPLRNVSQEKYAPEFPIEVDSKKQLFIDDLLIESKNGFTRKLHPVKKQGKKPLIVPEKPWEGKSVLLYGSVIQDPATKKFRLWYLAWGKHVMQPSFVCYAESVDGIKWIKPNLGIHEFKGSKENNILMPAWSQTTVLFDPSDPDPSRRFKAVLRLNGIRAFFSPDGLHWKDKGNIIEQGFDATTVHRDPVNQKWIGMVKIFRNGKRARGYAESTDFLNWTDTYYMASVDEKDLPGDQMYAIAMFHYETAYFGLLRMYHTSTDRVDIQLMTSRNSKQWNRDIRTPFIPNSNDSNAWDYANNSVPSSPPVRVGKELRFYYSSRNTLHDTIPNDGYIGLGSIRVDGFMSMDTNSGGGILTTKPLKLTGSKLFVNANVSPECPLKIQIIDKAGKIIKLNGQPFSDPITSDKIDHEIKWGTDSDIEALKEKTVRLRFHFTGKGSLYSFWTE
jgi:hypothetical protein